MDTITLKFHGHIEIPGGFSTQWPGMKGLPQIRGEGFIPASQIKGGLRRAALRAIVQKSDKKLFSVNDYYFNAVGGVKGKKTEEEKNADTSLTAYQTVRRSNPIVGLFGSGDVLGGMAAGHLYVGNGMPDGKATYGVFGGVRVDDSRRDPEGMLSLISGDGIDQEVSRMHQINRQRTAIKQEIKKLKRGFLDKSLDASARKKLDEEVKVQQKALDDLGGGNPVSLPLDGFQYIVAPSFTSSLTLKNTTMVELGLLLAAMEEQMLSDPFLGAHRSYGFGEFSAFWRCPDGEVTLKPFEPAVIQGDVLLRARDAFLAAVDGFVLGKEVSNEED